MTTRVVFARVGADGRAPIYGDALVHSDGTVVWNRQEGECWTILKALCAAGMSLMQEKKAEAHEEEAA